MRMKIGVAALAACLVAPIAIASPPEVIGLGARSTAMGGAVTASAEGIDALFYNVGALTLSEPRVTVGLMGTSGNAFIRLKDRPSGYDVPNLGQGTPVIPTEFLPERPSEYNSIDPVFTLVAGGTSNLGSNKLALGFALMFPLSQGSEQGTFFPDERESLFNNQLTHELRYRIQRFSFDFGLAFAPIEWLSLGIGAVFMPQIPLSTDIYVPDPGDQSVADINLKFRIGLAFGLHAGFVLMPTDRLRIALNFRDAVDFSIAGANQIYVRGFQAGDPSEDDFPTTQNFNVIPSGSPRMINLGVAHEFGALTIELDGRWSQFAARSNSQARSGDFRNTISARLGGEYAVNDDLSMRAGIGYVPSYVRDQTGRTNYVDNNRLLGSIGMGHVFNINQQELEMSWFFQFQGLLARDTNKTPLTDYPDCEPGVVALCDEVPDDFADANGEPDPRAAGLQTTNPGFPGFTSGGWLGTLGLDLTWRPSPISDEEDLVAEYRGIPADEVESTGSATTDATVEEESE